MPRSLLFTRAFQRASLPLVRGLRTMARSPQPASRDLSALLRLLASKDDLLRDLQSSKDAQQSSKDAQQASKDAQQAALQASKDAMQASKDAMQASKDALEATLRVTERELLTTSLAAQRDAAALAAALHSLDTARGRVSVRAALEQVIEELWAKYGKDKTAGATERLRQLAKGACPGLAPYVAACAQANQLSTTKALEMLPELYRHLSGPMHASSLDLSEDLPIEAVLQGDRTALVLVSCLFKLTHRDLRLYRMDNGRREPFPLVIPEPPVDLPTGSLA